MDIDLLEGSLVDMMILKEDFDKSKLEELGFQYDEDTGGYFKDLLFDYDELNPNRRYATLYTNKDGRFLLHRSGLYDALKHDRLIHIELDKIINSGLIKEDGYYEEL